MAQIDLTQMDPQGRVYWGARKPEGVAIWYDTTAAPQVSMKFHVGEEVFVELATFDQTDPNSTLALSSSGSSALGNLTDVDLQATLPSPGDALAFDGTAWGPSSALGAQILNDLNDVDTSSLAPNVGDILVFDGTNFVPQAMPGSADDLGDHTATQDLDLATFDIINAGNVSIDGQVLSADGGAISFGKAADSHALNETSYGVSAAHNNTANNLTAFGGQAGYTNTGLSATAVGYQALYANAGTSATALGYFAGKNNAGLRATMVGVTAGLSNQGSSATAIGFEAGISNTGAELSALGYQAGKDNTGATATAVGPNALDGNTGNQASALGKSAGVGNSFNNVTLLGANATADADNQIVLGDASIDSVITSGTIKSSAYGAGLQTGTAAFNLAVDSNGSLIETDTKTYSHYFEASGLEPGGQVITAASETVFKLLEIQDFSDAYAPSTGVFTVPETGLYVFMLAGTTTLVPGTAEIFKIMSTNGKLARFQDLNGGNTSTTISCASFLSAGIEIWASYITNSATDAVVTDDNQGRFRFTGWMMR